MIELKFRLVVVSVVWVYLIAWVRCSDNFHAEKSNRLLEDCERICQDSVPTEVPADNSQQSRVSCLEKCLLLPEENRVSENVSATTSPLATRSTVELFSVDTPTTTEASKNAACPRGDEYAPLPNETIPGEVTDIDVKFVKVRKGHKEEWVARVKWTGPRDVNMSSNWRGYMAIWYSDSSQSSHQLTGEANCKLMPKNQPHLDINEMEGWKYPNMLYLTIAALPTNQQQFPLKEYVPGRKDWRSSKVYNPAKYLKGHKRFTERTILLILAGILSGFTMILILYICVTKRKTFTAAKLQFTVDKKPGKKVDELKNTLIVCEKPSSDYEQFL